MRVKAAKHIVISLIFLLLTSCALLRPHFNSLDKPDTEIWPNTDFSLHAVPFNEFSHGGIPKDGIPAIDQPQFISVEDADWLDLREPVIAVTLNSETRAYPLQILLYHEIVNDILGGQAIAVTYCPLCNTAIVFDRTVKGQILDFGTTGMLRKSDLVMYDRQTESWWQQFTGEALVGKMTGTMLDDLPGQIITFAEFKEAYPKGELLSRNTGFDKPYGKNHMRYYDRVGGKAYYYFDDIDGRLPPLERVLSVTQAQQTRLYPLSVLKQNPIINDELQGLPIVTFSRDGMLTVVHKHDIAKSRLIMAAAAFERRLDGRLLTFTLKDGRIIDQQTQSQWNLLGQALKGSLAGKQLLRVDSGVHYAFAWLGFKPESEIYTIPTNEPQ